MVIKEYDENVDMDSELFNAELEKLISGEKKTKNKILYFILFFQFCCWFCFF